MLAPRRAVSRSLSLSFHRIGAAARRVVMRRVAEATLLFALLPFGIAPRVAVAPPNVSISPKTQTVNRAAGISNSESFTVTNTGNSSGSFSVAYTCSGVLQCSGGPLTNTLASGQTWTFSISHYNEQVGTGTLTVTASTSGASDQAVTTVQTYAPSFTLSPMTASETKPASSAQSSTYTVTNTAIGPLDLTTSVSCSGALTGCSVTPSAFNLASGAQRTVTANYTTGAASSTGAFALTVYTTGLNKTGTITVTAGSGSAAVSVTPKGTTVTRPSWTFPVDTFTVTNTGAASGSFTIVKSCSGGYVTCPGAGTSTQTIAAGASVSVPLAYETHGPPPGSGWVRVKATTGSLSDSATKNVDAVAPGGTVAINPTSASKPASSAQSSTFTVTNSGTATSTYTLAVVCTGSLTSCSVPAPTSITVNAGQSASVPVNYTTGAVGTTGTIQLTASTPNITPNATLSVTAVATTAVSVTPKNTGTTKGPSTTGNSVTFTVTNTGNATTTFALSGSCASAVTCSAYSNSVSLAAGASTTVPITYATSANNTGANITGTVQLTATAGAVSDAATYTVTVTPSATAGVTVTPKGSTVTVPSWTSQTQNFTVTNTGSASASFTITRSCTGWIIECTNAGTTTQTIAAGAAATVAVTYTTHGPPPNTGTITVNASTTGASDAATVNVSVVMPQGSVAVNPTSVTKPASSAQSSSFTVSNPGTAPSTYTLSVTCTAPLTTCSVPAPTSITVNAGQSASVPVNYTTGSAGSTGTITLTASTPNITPNATLTVTAATTNAIAVTPKGSSTTLGPNTTGNTFDFAVQNTGSAQTTFALSGSCAGAITCSAYSNSISPNAGVSTPVQLTFATSANNTGVNQTGTLTLSATGGGVSDAATYTVTVTPTPRAVSVSPTSGSASLWSGEQKTSTFTIQNTGGPSAVYSYSVTCQAPAVVSCTASSATGSGLTGQTGTLASGATFTVSVTYTGGTMGSTGNLTLQATDNATSTITATGAYGVAVSSSAPVIVSARALGLDGSVARNACLDMPLGKGASYECADLRVAYALPAMTTMNKTRQPTLLYLGSHANASAEIAVNVSLQGPTPSQVVPRLTIAGQTKTYSAVTWDPSTPAGTPRRITVPVDGQALGLVTGVYPYTLQVDVTTASGGLVQGSDTGSVTIVNRIASPFGRGWWLEGYEQLVSLSNPSRMMWVGGDGSSRVYTPSAQAPNTYTVKSPLDRPDTLVYVLNASNPSLSYYQRRLPNGARTEFDGFGRHVRTINAQGHITRFQHTVTTGRLNSIELPTPSAATTISYTFSYQSSADDPGITRLQSIHLAGPGVADQATHWTLTRGWVSQIQFLQSSDTGWASSGAITKFTYSPDLTANPSAAIRDLKSLEDADQHDIQFEYESGKLRRSTIPMLPPADNIVNTFCPAELRGHVAPSTSPSLPRCSYESELLANAYTWVDGPRLATDVLDHSAFHINRFGAPDTVVNALSKITRFIRDAAFPLLVRSIINPNGLTTNIVINGRGLPDQVTVVDPLGYNHPDSNSVTKYTWHGTWNLPLTVTTPTKEVTTFTYETAVAARKTQFDGRATTTFGYDPYWRVNSVTPPSNGSSSATYPDVGTTYDALGNLESVRSRLGTTTTMVRDAIGRVQTTGTPIRIANNLMKYLESTVAYYASGLPFRQTTTGDLLQGMVLTESVTLEHIYTKTGLPTSVRRTFTPDPSASQYGTSGLLTTWEYDAAGRRTKETGNDGFNEITSYDPAGNATRLQPKRRVTHPNIDIQMSYDVLNRMTQRVVPSVTYPAMQGNVQRNFSISKYSVAANNEAFYLQNYPQYPTQGNDYWIRPDVTDFVYDDVTNELLSANNSDGTVSRTYYRNGLLKTETQKIKRAPLDFLNPHLYTLRYSYDLGGRRRELLHPAALRAGAAGDRTKWSYDRLTGNLESIVDVALNQFDFDYHDDGSIASITRPGQIVEVMAYDADGRMTVNNVTSTGSPSRPWKIGTQVLTTLRQANLEYDLRDKLTTVSNTVGYTTSRQLFYSTLGYMMGSSFSGTNPTFACCATQFSIDEQYSYNGLGDILDSRPAVQYNSVQADPGSLPHRYSGVVDQGQTNNTFDANGRLVGVQHITANYDDAIAYDAAGNTHWTTQYNQGTTIPRDESVSYYGADNKLRAIDRRRMPDESKQMYKSVFEEYRYDPLGRRNWVRTRQWCQGANEGNGWCRLNKVRRIIWDGDQELYEIQMPDSVSPTFDFGDNDTAPLPVMTPFSIPVPGGGGVPEMKIDPNLMFGRVAYTRGIGVDAPISVVRFGYVSAMLPHDGNTWMPLDATPVSFPAFAIMPHWNSQGKAELGTVADGGATICNPSPFRCAEVFWPRMFTAYMEETGAGQRTAWFGTLLEDKRDASGLLYRRNRMYDPVAGRFTQEDPIGLAGGLNLYGYVGGDPVNYSDPLGLCPFPNPIVVFICAVGTRASVFWLARAGPAIATAGAASTGLTAGSIRNVNPGFPAAGRISNCVNCAIAADATLAGRPASALPGAATAISELEKVFGRAFRAIDNIDDAKEALINAGHGARAIIYGSRGPGEVGHVFNAVNQNGVIRFLDGQTGREAVISGFQQFLLLPTNR